MKNQSFLLSTTILAVVNILIKVLGFIYRIILVRLIGAEGLGLFELISPITMLVFTMVGSGVPIAIIRLITQSIANNKKYESIKIVEYTSLIMFFVSLLLSIILFLGAPFIANSILRDERLLIPLYIFAPAIIFPSLAAILRGYFYGIKNVIPPALSQFLEQVARIFMVFALLSILYPFKEDKAIIISMVAVVFSEFIGLLLLIYFFKINKKNSLVNSRTEKLPFLSTMGKFSTIALPITLSRVVNSLLRVATSIIIPSRLMVSGLDNPTALSKYGEINGMAIPLLFLPYTLTSALVMNLIPRISEAIERKNFTILNLYADKAFHLVFFIALPLSGIFYAYSNEIFSILYASSNGLYLAQLSMATLFLCIYQISASILQGIGKQMISTIVYVLGMSLQLILNYILVALPKYQITGYILSYLLTNFLISIVNFILVLYFAKVKINYKKWILLPGLSCLLALLFSKFSLKYLLLNFNENIAFFITILIIGITYFACLLISGNIKSLFNKFG
ncbi:MAG TPA: polysaccharide biosynthesis protein [Eubacteriaceae bacterium]|nr:polysaccharide biosynthesis protein [Eubacteriaceae bacterium]